MADEIGKHLYEDGWRQGSVFGPLSHLVHFRIDEPLNIPGVVVDQSRASYLRAKSAGELKPAVGQAVRRLGAKDRWVIASQDCDLVKSASSEPYVQAIRCFVTKKEGVLVPAAANSSRFFLMDRETGLVADATLQIQIEKPVLSEFEPKLGIPSEEERHRFARWLARRADRPATPDHIIETFVKPVLDGFRGLRGQDAPLLDCLDEVTEIRFRALGVSPVEVDLLFFLGKGLPLDGGLALADLVYAIQEWMEPSDARLNSWDTVSLADISVEDYLATEQLYLDHYTFRGETQEGLGPPPRI